MKTQDKPIPLGLPSQHMPIPKYVRPAHDVDFCVLKLPKKGAELFEGRQYELSPVARAYIDETWGLVLPRVVECLHRKRPGTRLATLSTNLETGESSWSVMIDPPRPATFRAYMTGGKIHVFVLDLEWLAEREHESAESHKVSEYEDKDFQSLSRAQKDKFLGISSATGRPKKQKADTSHGITPDNILSLLNL